MKTMRSTLAASILITLVAILGGSASAHAQISTGSEAAARTVPPVNEISFVDGRGGLGERGRLSCGQASPVAMGKFSGPKSGGATGPNVKVDLSFGYYPFARVRFPAPDRFGPNETFFGSWAVRNIVGSSPETVGLIYFRGNLTSGSFFSGRGQATQFDLYGVTTLSGPVCGVEGTYEANRDARRYVRLTGVCGNDQEVMFQLSRRPPVDHDGDLSFEQADIFSYGTFRGNISCGQTTDRSRVRTSLSN